MTASACDVNLHANGQLWNPRDYQSNFRFQIPETKQKSGCYYY